MCVDVQIKILKIFIKCGKLTELWCDPRLLSICVLNDCHSISVLGWQQKNSWDIRGNESTYYAKSEFLLVLQILVSFPQFLSVGALILHEVAQCTLIFSIFYWSTSKNAWKKYFNASKWSFVFPEIILLIKQKIYFF